VEYIKNIFQALLDMRTVWPKVIVEAEHVKLFLISLQNPPAGNLLLPIKNFLPDAA
jgi:hypothetical protein